MHIPLAHDAKAKSSTRRSTRNPEWNQEFCFSNVTREQLKSSKLEITVWTQEGFQEKEFLGGIKLFSSDGEAISRTCLLDNIVVRRDRTPTLSGVKLFYFRVIYELFLAGIDNSEVELWEKALNSPDKSFTAVLHLRSTMDELLID